MIDYSKKYMKIVDDLIRKSFPELKGKKVIILEFILPSIFLAMTLDFSFVRFIFTNPKKIELCSYNGQKGLFVHELCHFERHFSRNFFEKILFILKYVFNRRARVEEERETDKLTINKGYSKNLFSLVKGIEEIRTKEQIKLRLTRGYLSSKQIKQYAIKIGKWQ